MNLPEGKDRIKLFVVIGVLLLASVWIMYSMTTLFGSRYGSATVPDSPAWTLSNEINSVLIADQTFHDVGVSVLSESPLKLKVDGIVKTEADLEALKKLLQEKAPTAEFEYGVTIPG